MISFEDFKKIVTKLDEIDIKIEQFSDCMSEFGDCWFMPSSIYELCNLNVELLQRLLNNGNNDDDMFEYWYYEIEKGTKWIKGCVTDTDGSDIKLQTLEDVYNYYKKENEKV